MDFMVELKEYKAVSLAITFIMGIAATALVQSLLIISSCLITPFFPKRA